MLDSIRSQAGSSAETDYSVSKTHRGTYADRLCVRLHPSHRCDRMREMGDGVGLLTAPTTSLGNCGPRRGSLDLAHPLCPADPPHDGNGSKVTAGALAR